MLEIATQIEAVTVYRRGAVVTRVARLEAPFPQAVALVGLPLSLQDSSLRVELSADGGAPPIAGDVQVTVSVPGEDPRLPPPDDAELEAAELAHAKARREVDELSRALTRLDAVEVARRGAPERGKAPIASPTGARLELLAFRRRRADTLHEGLVAARGRLHEADERLATLRERRRVASDERNVATWEVRKAAVVRLAGGDAATATLRLQYTVPGARWAPAYTVRLDREMDRGTIEVRAMVGQATGEDWRGVALTLSTASPQQWTELPELRSLRIGRTQAEPPKTGWRPPPVGADKLYEDYDRDLARPPTPKPVMVGTATEYFAAEAEGDYDGVAVAAAEAASRRAGGPPVQGRGVPHGAALGGAVPPPVRAPGPAGGPVPPPAAAPVSGGMPPPAPAPTPARARRAEPAAEAAPLVAPQSAAGPDMFPEPTRAMPKSAGIGSLLAGVAGAAVEGVASAFGGGGGDGYRDSGVLAEEPAAAQLLAGRDLLDYGRLQLYPADDARRGALRRVDARVLYQHVMLSVESLSIDVAFEQIAAAQTLAGTLDRAAAPARHHDPRADGGFDYAYVADAPVDLDSDGRFHAVAVLQADGTARPRYISVPRETQDVFRIVALRNPLDAPILPGPADVYVDGKFTLTSDLELTPAGGKIELGLGVEQAIKIARNVDFEEDTSGLIKRQHDLLHTLKLEVANHLSRTALVEIRERVPVTREGDDDIEVEEREVDPPWEEYEQKPSPLEGGRVWKVEVPAGGKRELRATWVASIPSGYELVGGNRRES